MYLTCVSSFVLLVAARESMCPHAKPTPTDSPGLARSWGRRQLRACARQMVLWSKRCIVQMPLPCTECLSRVVYVSGCVFSCLPGPGRERMCAHAKPTPTNSPRASKVAGLVSGSGMYSQDVVAGYTGRCHARSSLWAVRVCVCVYVSACGRTLRACECVSV